PSSRSRRMNFEKLKDAARKYEQKEEWRRAIEVYLQAIREFEAGHDPVPDLAIYNRIGDLYLKANEPGAAVQAYERAADLYAEQGFYNNAIALCGKILRVNPGRIQVYLKLAYLHARKNVVIDAKKNLLEYLERMNALGQLDAAFKALREFADQFPGNKDIRLMLVELLRASSRNAEAREELEKLASDLEARGDTIGARKTLMKLQALEQEESGAEKAATKPKGGELVFLDTGLEAPGPRSGRAPRKTVPTPAPRKSEARRPSPRGSGMPSGLPLIDVAEEHPSAPSPPEVPPEPLEVETSSLVDTPLTLEPVQPLSDEARLEATASGDVARALGFEPTRVEPGQVEEVTPLEGLELDQALPDNVELDAGTPGLELERATDLGEDLAVTSSVRDVLLPDPLDVSPELAADLTLDLEGEPARPSDTGQDGLGLELIEPGAEFGTAESGAGERISFLQVETVPTPSISELEDRVLDDPDDPETHRALGEALIASGETLRGQEELELALSGYETREDWGHASDLLEELIRLEPNGVRYHQKRVEVAFRTGDRARLVDAYVELADALVRVGAVDKALAVYRRVVEHDPENTRALAAIDALTPVEEPPPPPPPQPGQRSSGRRTAPAEPAARRPSEALEEGLEGAFTESAAGSRRSGGGGGSRSSEPAPAAGLEPGEGGGDFVDLGALILDDHRPRDTRMRVEDEEPTGDEQRDFEDMLQQFKRGIEENIAAEDFQAHYDLGVAFKEMGLLDEAIAEFQKALRAPEVRLKTTEALGTAFFEKGQYAIAEAILRRGVESLGATDDEQIGLLYWLGRAQEAQGKVEVAVPNYERVLAVDIGFQDTSQRMARLLGRKR
ncbi:MAG TPA: tetratricopeptide repeat protein, partial [Gemmatimonadales bacterium]|nr:tetratricopeptide repeat protein [Gemmatimonadales bacterium]